MISQKHAWRVHAKGTRYESESFMVDVQFDEDTLRVFCLGYIEPARDRSCWLSYRSDGLYLGCGERSFARALVRKHTA